MEGSKAMALSGGSNPFYIHGGSVSMSQPSSLRTPSRYRALANSSAVPDSSEPLPIEASSDGFPISSASAASEPVKRKRGRPRKYAPDGQISLGFSSLPAKPKPLLASDPMAPKRARGRPPGTGRKQRLATLGEWMNSSAGFAFAPHVIKIGVGEDIVSKIVSFSQQRPRAVCVLAGTGSVSSFTLRSPAPTALAITYDGWFEILCLSGSYLVAEDGGSRGRTGGVSASLSSADGHVIGGALAVLIAATPVRVILCSFVYDSGKVKDKLISGAELEAEAEEKEISPPNAPPIQSFSQDMVWSGGNSYSDIDLAKG